MENRRRFLRFDTSDFLEIEPLGEPAKISAEARNINPLGICFFSPQEFRRGQSLKIYYFIPDQMQPSVLRCSVVWCEYISDEKGFLVGVEISDVEVNPEGFMRYYFRKIGESFWE